MTQEQWKNRNKKQSSNHIWLKDEMTDKELWSGAFNALASSKGELYACKPDIFHMTYEMEE